jgi:hypothetical protein
MQEKDPAILKEVIREPEINEGVKPSEIEDIPKVDFNDDQGVKRKFVWTRRKKIVAGILGVILLAIVVSIYPIIQVMGVARSLETSAKEASSIVQSQDLTAVEDKVDQIEGQLRNLQTSYKLLFWWKATPLRWHYIDGERAINAAIAAAQAGKIMVEAIEPHADVLGLKGEGSFTGGTTEDRIVLILETFGELLPSLDQVEEKLVYAKGEVDSINPERYPFSIGGNKLSDLIGNAQEAAGSAVTGVGNARPIIEVLPTLAGVDETRRYLVLFQNDAELRPTGGFMTAYAIMDVTKGRIVAERSVDIYSLDAKFGKRLERPEPIEKYLPLVFYWNLRDMNLSPDFKESMDTFISYYEEVPGETEVDGVIAIDTNVLKDLVGILGPIEVDGYGTFSNEIDERCDCPQVIYKLEDLVTRPTYEIRTDRKAVLGPMMQTLLQKAYDADSNAWPELFRSTFKNIDEKHILFYMKDSSIQEAAERINIAGRIREFNGDYLHINDANFGGAKSNIFVTQEVEHEIEIGEGQTTKTVTMAYKNPFVASNCNLEAGQLCLNGVLRDFMRIYVPMGSELVESLGFEEDTVKTYDELGKTVIEGFFLLQPQSQTKLVLKYTVPYSPEDEYRLMIQKQPGTYSPKHAVTVGSNLVEVDLVKDTTLELPL